jgi:hypothetical protein
MAEYGGFAARQLTSEQIAAAAGVGDRIVNAVASSLATARRRRPR